jgi:hypothetical protein
MVAVTGVTHHGRVNWKNLTAWSSMLPAIVTTGVHS